ncbi:hypothetical protein CMK14_05395 [Candidatus Poribacteria bacterium]|nr:hypothetical protein [Candidatus Poribacteria bacterium]
MPKPDQRTEGLDTQISAFSHKLKIALDIIILAGFKMTDTVFPIPNIEEWRCISSSTIGVNLS